jgi:hypothetical protein
MPASWDYARVFNFYRLYNFTHQEHVEIAPIEAEPIKTLSGEVIVCNSKIKNVSRTDRQVSLCSVANRNIQPFASRSKHQTSYDESALNLPEAMLEVDKLQATETALGQSAQGLLAFEPVETTTEIKESECGFGRKRFEIRDASFKYGFKHVGVFALEKINKG